MFSLPFTCVDAAAVRPAPDSPAADARRGVPRAPSWRARMVVALFLGAALVLFAGNMPNAATPRLLAAAQEAAAPHPGAGPAAAEGPAGRPQPEAPSAESLEPAAPEAFPATPEDAAAQISGSQWPGVINHLLLRPQPGTSGGSTAEPQGPDIHIDYPSLGIPAVDADIRAWVTGIANAFTTHLDLSRHTLPDMDTDADPAGLDAHAAPEQGPAFGLWGSYSISRPSDAAVSITFEIWNYTGASQGNLDILTLNYSLLTGQRLAFMDLFEKPETALTLMSDWSRKELAPRLGASMRLSMLDEGTAPLVENFSSLTLTPQGICINFQPYQVAPWAAGVQKVEMPLEALLPARPLLALWGR